MMRKIIDLWLDRGMKTIGILGFVAAAIMGTTGLFFLPQRVAANEADIQNLKDKNQKFEKDFAVIASDIKYIVKSIDQLNEKASHSS